MHSLILLLLQHSLEFFVVLDVNRCEKKERSAVQGVLQGSH